MFNTIYLFDQPLGGRDSSEREDGRIWAGGIIREVSNKKDFFIFAREEIDSLAQFRAIIVARLFSSAPAPTFSVSSECGLRIRWTK